MYGSYLDVKIFQMNLSKKLSTAETVIVEKGFKNARYVTLFKMTGIIKKKLIRRFELDMEQSTQG